MKKIVFIEYSRITDIIVYDSIVNNSYEYIPPHKFLFFFNIPGKWVIHDWGDTFNVNEELFEKIKVSHLIKDNKVYNKPYVLIRYNADDYTKSFDTFDEAYTFAEDINRYKCDFELRT